MIGVFDSGSGGVTILAALQRQLPDQDFLYLGDHANAPYGHRSNEQIVELTKAGVDMLMKAGCSLVVLACNTAAAVALRHLQQNWLPHAYPDNRVLGVLVPTVEALTGVPWSQQGPTDKKQPAQKIALFATRKTVESEAYTDEILKRAPHLSLSGQACPGLVDAIEGGAGPLPLAGLVSGYVAEADTIEADAVVLGCTHFPLVKQHFEDALPDGMVILSQPEIVATSLADYLIRHPRFSKSSNGNIKILTTGDPHEIDAAEIQLPAGFTQFTSAKNY